MEREPFAVETTHGVLKFRLKLVGGTAAEHSIHDGADLSRQDRPSYWKTVLKDMAPSGRASKCRQDGDLVR